MKYAKDRKLTSSHTAEVLIESFPWIKNITGKTVVIKYGGAAMVDEKLRSAVMADIVRNMDDGGHGIFLLLPLSKYGSSADDSGFIWDLPELI